MVFEDTSSGHEKRANQVRLIAERQSILAAEFDQTHDLLTSRLDDPPTPSSVGEAPPDEATFRAEGVKAIRDIALARKEAITTLGDIITSEEASGRIAVSAAAKEANGRVVWQSYFGLQIMATVGAIIGAIWIISVSIEEQTSRPVRGRGTVDRHDRKAYGSYVPFLVLAVWMSFVLVWWLAEVVFYKVFDDWNFAASERNGVLRLLPSIQDNATDFIARYLWPTTSRLVEIGITLLIVAAVLLVSAVSWTVVQRPEDVDRRLKPDDVEQKNREYDEFLTRCFERLRVAVFIGGFMLVVCVLQVNARYTWFLTVVPGDEEGQTLHATLAAMASQLGLSYGLIFTSFLAAAYLPAYVVLMDSKSIGCTDCRRIAYGSL
jgi:hypothetical protein